MSSDKPIYLSGLNGIRAIAATGVLFSHINLNLSSFGVNKFSFFGFVNNKHAAWSLGEQGVTMFFVLSGFLITYLLVIEKNKLGTINRGKFYMRRILRIWPLYYLALTIALVTLFLINSSMEWEVVLSFVFLAANIPFILGIGTICGHLWSIAVEEQFYLFWPFFFKRKIPSTWLLLTIVAIMSVVRALLWYAYPYKLPTLIITVNRFDCMIFGGVMAILYQKRSPIIEIVKSWPIQLVSWLIIGVHFFNFEIINSIVSLGFITLATGCIICGQIGSKQKIINLENPVLDFLGKYSFGIYVYHPFLIYFIGKNSFLQSFDDGPLKGILVSLVIVISTIFISYFSYQYFERYFIHLKARFSLIHSKGSR